MSKIYYLIVSLIILLLAKSSTAQFNKSSLSGIYTEKKYNTLNISVFGTNEISSEELATGYADILNELKILFQKDKEQFNIKRDELENILKNKFAFSYCNVHLFKSYVGNEYFIFDFVSKADSSERLRFREIENITYSDSDNLIAKWTEYETLSFELFNAGELTTTDCPVHHCIWGFDHPKLQPYFDYFEKFVPQNKDKLIEILNDSESERYRANAAFLLAHLKDSENELLTILEPSINDPSSIVRNNSMRVIYYLVKKNPGLELDLEKVVQALNYPSNYDRNKALVILRTIPLDNLTEQQIARCLPTLFICIKDKDHNASNAYLVLKKISGKDFSNSDIESWKTWCDNYLNQ